MVDVETKKAKLRSSILSRIANAGIILPSLNEFTEFDENSDTLDDIDKIELISSSTKILDKLNKHRKNEPVVAKKEEEVFKWVRIKEQMIADMEKNRDEEWKKQLLDEKLNNEELEEELFGDDDLSDEEEEDEFGENSTKEKNAYNDDENEDDCNEERENVNSDEEVEDEELDIDRFPKTQNAFIDDQADEDNSGESDNDFDDDDDLFTGIKCKAKHKFALIDSDGEVDDEQLPSSKIEVDFDNERKGQNDDSNDYDNNAKINEFTSNETAKSSVNSPFPFPNLDTQDDQGVFAPESKQFCISQNLPLTPLDGSQESRSPSNSSLFETSGFQYDSDNFDNDSQLADMCSGKFGPAKTSSENGPPDGVAIENGSKEEVEEEEAEEVEDEEEPIVINRKKHRVSDFFENEAELSGSDGEVSSDEEENDDDELDEEDDIQEDLPSDDELRDQVEKIHNKALLDEDKRQLMIMKEYFFDDGDLHDDDGDRKKKFKWNLNDGALDQFANVLSDSSDEDDSNVFGDDDSNERKVVVRLRKSETMQTTSGKILTTTIEEVINEESNTSEAPSGSPKPKATTASMLKKAFISPKMTLRPTLKKKTNSKISSYFMKDERLKTIFSKRPINSNSSNPSKRQKTGEAKSIFDVLG